MADRNPGKINTRNKTDKPTRLVSPVGNLTAQEEPQGSYAGKLRRREVNQRLTSTRRIGNR